MGHINGDVVSKKMTLQLVNTDKTRVVNHTYSASISAANKVTINAKNSVNNATIQANAAKVAPSGKEQTAKETGSANIKAPGALNIANINLPTINNVPFPDFRLPTGPNGLFIYSDGPESRYLIETNPLLTNLGNYLGSDYFLGNVGFNPNKDITFLGDAFYDTRIITQAILEQTGQRYLTSNVGSDLTQMQQLMDAAASQKNKLNLALGIALTAEQVANLTQDILWYEKIDVNGKTVLAPKLYLAKLTRDNISNGALIAGRDIDINTGEITNSGAMLANNTLSLKSDSTIRNDTGTLSGGGDISLTAKDDILNLSGQIKGKNVAITSVDGLVINQTLSQQNQYDANYVTTDIGSTSQITSTGALTINAGTHIVNEGAHIAAKGDAALHAGNDILFTTIEDKTHKIITGARSTHEALTIQHQGAELVTGGDISLNAGENLTLTSANVTTQNDLNIKTGGSITIDTAINESYQSNKGRGKTEISHQKRHQASNISGANVAITSGESVTLSGSHLLAKNSASITAKDDINILAVNDSDYHYVEEKKKKSFGRSKTTIHESLNETVKGSAINAGSDITLTAQALSSTPTAGGDSDISIIGSELNAQNNINLNTDGDVILAAQQYKEYERNETIKKGFGGLSNKHKGSIDDATLLNSSYALSGNNINVNAGNNIAVVASEVVSNGEVNLAAIDEVLISAGEVLKQSQQWSEESSFLSGGNLFEMETKRDSTETSTAQSSVIQSGANLNINAGSIKVVGSDIVAGKNLALTADTGDIEILAAKETTTTRSFEETITAGFGDMDEIVKVEDGQLKISLGKAAYDKVDNQTDSANHKGSKLVANNTVNLNASADILIEGSTLNADANKNNNGDINLTAVDNITIKEAKDNLKSQTEEIHGKAEVSLVVQHQAVEVAKAAMAVKAADKALRQSQKDYKQYKKQLDSLENTLATLQQEYDERKPGVNFEDIEELTDLVAQVKSDEAWYVAGITLAAADAVSKTTLLVQQIAAAAQSSGTYGFNAGLNLDIEASKTKSQHQQTTSVASTLSGQNITINAGNKEGNHATLQGANLKANDSISLDANEVNILASKESESRKSSTKSGSISASMTVYGASSGINLNASLNRSESTSNSLTHTNSTVNADNINITSTQDTNIIGGNVNANKALNVNVGGDLNVASVQDRHSSSNKGMGFSGGLSLSGGEVPSEGKKTGGIINNSDGNAGNVTGANAGTNASSGRSNSKDTLLTTLTSGGNANITVGGNTDLQGALIATVDNEGNDLGNLNLTTDTFTYADLSNTDYSQNQSMGINTSVGVNGGEIDATNNSTNLQYKNESDYSKGKNLATLGLGTVLINDTENSDNITALNRDTLNTEKELFDVDRKQGDIDVTLDHRLLSEDGRKEIKEDIDNVGENIQIVAQNVPAAEGGNVVENAVGKTLDTLGELTAGVIPSNKNHGGIIAQLPGLIGIADNKHRVIEGKGKGKGKSNDVYVNGMMNTEAAAKEGAKNVTGSVNSTTWYNPTHGLLGDLLESAVDKFGNHIGVQTGISKQIETLQDNNSNKVIHMHSQGNLISVEGANTNNTYKSYGSPMSKNSVTEKFNVLDPEQDIQQNEGDYVSKPSNVMNPKTWDMPGHGTENYGAAREISLNQSTENGTTE
ncbi:hemagglutinin repeat-containing protein [Vibrio algarum]|uniref:Hemagglutinin repeat-containing protein n=1 Tax=Vibrio algarum TaxID=3020714 RepID=A0ABT4YWP4_9VIBR|nr:hemagglutinin repeat-containing protein [Vibrio sp. KJ40-1]MDB1125444.1 hemagglutinin repeat-containing protein [Vibrio sp. KJ40-1]